ncbi:hypothetical protein NHX12_017815 [Muraenolepis orangiensis]|uniref:Uncharacterized protein n=1 Tax=Muraenolepis orangiensis TaxID=630683 RepID=A0A9Q0EVF5_9TELE|nr:hypothetical protein NHX12_017815 [Muraenolepis orangiensis]
MAGQNGEIVGWLASLVQQSGVQKRKGGTRPHPSSVVNGPIRLSVWSRCTPRIFKINPIVFHTAGAPPFTSCPSVSYLREPPRCPHPMLSTTCPHSP